MTVSLARGRLTARLAHSPEDLRAAQRLRHECFITAAGLPQRDGGLDRDRFDSACRHALIESDGLIVATFRLMSLPSGAALGRSYAAQFYDLTRLMTFPGPVTEVGRFCIAPVAIGAGDALRLAWALLTRLVDAEGVAMLIGCSSFTGTDPGPHQAALSLLAAHYQAPDRWRPGIGPVGGLPLPQVPVADRIAALSQMPPLLRTYLGMGGWVSGHAVGDVDLRTLHVFTGVAIADIPPARARALRTLAAGVG